MVLYGYHGINGRFGFWFNMVNENAYNLFLDHDELFKDMSVSMYNHTKPWNHKNHKGP